MKFGFGNTHCFGNKQQQQQQQQQHILQRTHLQSNLFLFSFFYFFYSRGIGGLKVELFIVDLLPLWLVWWGMSRLAGKLSTFKQRKTASSFVDSPALGDSSARLSFEDVIPNPLSQGEDPYRPVDQAPP